MSDTTHTPTPRPRRFWFNEALIVAAVLAFGGFVFASDTHLSATDFIGSVARILGF